MLGSSADNAFNGCKYGTKDIHESWIQYMDSIHVFLFIFSYDDDTDHVTSYQKNPFRSS